MALTASDMTPADIAAVTGNNSNGFFGGNDGGYWIFILFLFAFLGWGGNGWGGNGNGGVIPDMQRGFDQSAVMNSLNGITSAVSNGFAGAEVSRCNQQANLLGTLANNQMGMYQALNTASDGIAAQLNTIAMNQQNCCCENRAAVADLKYTVATEACNDRAAVGDALQAVLNSVNSGIQSLKDQMCNDKIDAKNEQIAALQNQLAMASLRESQTAQTAQLLADNARQTAILNPAPIPAYVVTRPCGCNGSFGFNG